MLSFWIWTSGICIYLILGAYLLRKTWYSDGMGDFTLFPITCIWWPILVGLCVFWELCELGIYLAEKGDIVDDR